MVMEHGPFDDKHDGPVHKAFRNGGKSAEFCATRHQALYEWETMRQLEEDTYHSDLVGVPPHPKQIPKSPWLVQSHCHDDWMNWRMQAWVTTGASDQFLRRLAIQLMNGACVWNCLGWRELGHFSTWMMLWPPFLQSRLYPTQWVLLCQCMNEWCAQGIIWAHKRRRSCVAMVRIHRIFKICNAVCTRRWVALLMSI